MSKGHSRRTLAPGRCSNSNSNNKGKTKNAVCVDVEKSTEYIFIDVPEPSPKKPVDGNVIDVDDDDNNVGTTKKMGFDGIKFARGKRSPVTFSKSRRTYSEKTTCTRNRYGLGGGSDSDSDSDSSDCEILEESSGNVREQWEKAARKKRMGDCGLDGASTSANANVDDLVGDPHLFANLEKFTMHENVYIDDRGKAVRFPHSPDTEMECDANEAESEIPSKSGCVEDVLFQENEETVPAESFWFNYEEKFETGSNDEKVTVLDEEVPSANDERSEQMPASYWKDFASDVGRNHWETCFGFMPTPNFTNYEKAESSEKESLFSGEPSLWSNQSHEKMHAHSDVVVPTQKDESVCGECFSDNKHMQHDSEVILESVCHEDNVKSASELVPSNFKDNKVAVIHPMTCSMVEKEPTLEVDDNAQSKVETSSSHVENGNDGHDTGNILIGDREKLKETDEYKRAAEEEWASRQRQLQLQAEEVQRLRKRKRAEAQRLLDMEKRQKERVEEMRETQKKNVETINLKEQLRAEVRKELDKLEMIHTDMVSLLRALGIRVGSGFCPNSREINAAYKQALLKFHPDRASKTDVRQQVEAEEKFKLVSRLKEKLSTSTPKFF